MLEKPCKIVIPSHKRADRVTATRLFNNAIICVEESQRDLYQEYNPDYEIVCHPDSLKGLIPKRNWMLKKFGELFMVDDDATSFRRVYIEEGESSMIHSKEEIETAIYSLHELAKLMGISVFGFSKNPRPEQFDVFEPFTLRSVVNGGAYGVIDDGVMKWNEDLKLKEDFWISCWCKYHNRVTLVDKRYNFSHADTFANQGGLSEIRNNHQELVDMLKIRKHFGECVKIKKEQISASLKKEFNITVTFPY